MARYPVPFRPRCHAIEAQCRACTLHTGLSGCLLGCLTRPSRLQMALSRPRACGCRGSADQGKANLGSNQLCQSVLPACAACPWSRWEYTGSQ